MPESAAERLEMRVSPEVKERLRRAAGARGMSLTGFAIEALTRAAEEVLSPKGGGGRRPLGWATGTAEERGDIVSPAVGADEWAVLSS